MPPAFPQGRDVELPAVPRLHPDLGWRRTGPDRVQGLDQAVAGAVQRRRQRADSRRGEDRARLVPGSAQLLGVELGDRVPPGGLAVGVAAWCGSGAALARPAERSLRASRPRPPREPMPRCRCGPSARGSRWLDELRLPVSARDARAAAPRARRLPVARTTAAAHRDLVPEPRRARIGRDPLQLAPPPDRRPAARRRGAALRRRRAPAGADRHDLGPGHGGAGGRCVVLDGRDGRCSEPARGSAGRDHVLREPRAEPRQGRPRLLCRRLCRRHLADDRPRPPQGRHRVARPGYGTAIGDALGRGVELTRLSTGQGETATPAAIPSSTGAIVLLSDGTQTNGLLSPDDGAKLAKEAGIPVYTIALGTLTGTVTIDRNGRRSSSRCPPTGRRWRASPSRREARRSTSPTRRSSAPSTSGSARSSRRRPKPREVSAGFVGVAALLLTLAIGLAALSAPRLP